MRDGVGKMSKSDPSGCLFLDDSPESIRAKILKAKTDSTPKISYDKDSRQSLAGLIEIMASLQDSSPEAVVQNYGHLNHSQFKFELSNILIHNFKEFREKYNSFETELVQDLICAGSIQASKIASDNFSIFLELLNK